MEDLLATKASSNKQKCNETSIYCQQHQILAVPCQTHDDFDAEITQVSPTSHMKHGEVKVHLWDMFQPGWRLNRPASTGFLFNTLCRALPEKSRGNLDHGCQPL